MRSAEYLTMSETARHEVNRSSSLQDEGSKKITAPFSRIAFAMTKALFSARSK